MDKQPTMTEATQRAHMDAVDAWHKALTRLSAARVELHAAESEMARAENALTLARQRAVDSLKKPV